MEVPMAMGRPKAVLVLDAEQQGHGGRVAAPILSARRARTLRRATDGPPSPDQRRACSPIGSQDAQDETQSRDALEHPTNIRGDPAVEIDRASHLASVWFAAAPTETLQAFQ